MKTTKTDFPNIWKLYYLLLSGALALIIVLLYIRYTDITQRYHAQLRYYTDIVSKSVSANYLQDEIILSIFGKQLLKNNNYKNSAKSQELLDDLLKNNKYFAVLGIADIDGNILLSSSNVNLSNKKIFLKKKTTSYDFKRALSSDEMVIGETYFFRNINEWIIPLIKLIKDSDGNILGVAIAGLKNEINTNYIDNIALSKNKTILIVKDFNDKKELYRQYYSNTKGISNEDLYKKTVSTKIFNAVNDAVKKKYGYYIDKLRVNNKTISVEVINRFNQSKISAIKYDSRYKLWILIAGYSSDVWNEFKKIALIYLILFILSFIIFYFLFKNIATSEIRKKNELIYLTQHDILTGLPNRIYMYSHIDSWKKKHNEKYDVLYIDLDNFKNINDKFGHTVGDDILIEVAQRLKSFFDDEDMLIRQGGDEFIVLKECADESKIEEKLSALISLVSKRYYVDNREFRIGMSLGIAKYPNDAQTIEELLSLADTAMYEAKKRKNSYSFFSEKMRHKSLLKTDIEQELRGAIENHELWMVYQPQMNMDGSIYGVEALVRWENKKLGFVGPDKFISVAEDSGLIKEIGKFIIETSLREIISVHAELKTIFSLSINISVIQLMEVGFLEDILGLINKEAFDKSLITLEITESLSIEDLDEVLPILHAIREEGMEISLDDFGTGYSSLSMLRELPINELKIDKSFIDKILYDESENSLVKSIIDIGKNFKMKTLAEGVENLAQLQELKLAKCDIIQGYYYSKPLVKDNLIKYIEKLKEDR